MEGPGWIVGEPESSLLAAELAEPSLISPSPAPTFSRSGGARARLDPGGAPNRRQGQIVDAAHGEQDLVVWRTFEGEPCVMEARCPHEWSHLGAEGVVDGLEILCTAHFWRFHHGRDGQQGGHDRAPGPQGRHRRLPVPRGSRSHRGSAPQRLAERTAMTELADARILITGATGQVGPAHRPAPAEHNDVIGVARFSDPARGRGWRPPG